MAIGELEIPLIPLSRSLAHAPEVADLSFMVIDGFAVNCCLAETLEPGRAASRMLGFGPDCRL